MFLEKPPKKAPGGLCKISLFDISDGIENSPDIVNLKYREAYEFTGDADWQEFYFEQFGFNAEESRVETSGSPGYRYTLSGFLHFDSAERMAILHQSERREYLVKTQDIIGLTKVIGTPESPVSIITPKRSAGRRYEEGNRIEVVIQCTNPEPFAEYPF